MEIKKNNIHFTRTETSYLLPQEDERCSEVRAAYYEKSQIEINGQVGEINEAWLHEGLYLFRFVVESPIKSWNEMKNDLTTPPPI